MLTRLKINGFKNLRDIDLRFGFFTCIAGANGVGKSNLFDAICFLSNLASMKIIDAAILVRGTDRQLSSIKGLFSFDRDGRALPMEFVIEAITPQAVEDDFGRSGSAFATYLEYSLTLCLSENESDKDPIYIKRERLKKKVKRDAKTDLGFTTSDAFIKQFVVDSKNKRTTPFIETTDELETQIIKLYREDGKAGQPPKIPARGTPQTVLASINSVSYPTALALRREMQSWKLLQLEPSALRQPDEFGSSSRVEANGGHLAAALYRIGLYADVAAELSNLISGIDAVEVDSNEVRRLRTLCVQMGGHKFTASALSDGTLRFLALAIMACDPDAHGLICMEEPENGIHPLRIPQIVKLVHLLSDTENQESDTWSGVTNLRQVIINTHSPLVVEALPSDELLMAETRYFQNTQLVQFKPVKDQKSWRGNTSIRANEYTSKGQLIHYLSGPSVKKSGKEGPRSVHDLAFGENATQIPLL